MSLLPSWSISSDNACENAVPTHVPESFTTRTLTPACLALITHCMALISLLVRPAPEEGIHFTAIICAVQFSPLTPIPLLVAAPIIPAMCVPCPAYTVSSSMGLQVLLSSLKPFVPAGQLPIPPGFDHMLDSRSGWLY